jgi:branched-subunit amino acid transport protein
MTMTVWEAVAVIFGLGVISVVTRSFFLIPKREVPIPHWLREALRFAPLAALVAVVVPEIALDANGHLLATWHDAKLFGAAAAALVFWRTRSLLTMIVVGTAVFLALRLVLGW